MASLALDGSAIGPARQRFCHMTRPQTMRRVRFLEVCRAASTFDDAIDGLFGEARQLDAATTDRTEYRILALMFDFGRLEPCAHSSNRTGPRTLARHNHDGPPLPFLIRFRSAEHYAQHAILEFEIADIERHDFRATEAASESEQNDRFVPDLAQIETEGLADRSDVFRAQRPRTLWRAP